MEPNRQPRPARRTFTVVVEVVGGDAWHLTVRELPDTWTIAFAEDELAALLERRAHRRDELS